MLLLGRRAPIHLDRTPAPAKVGTLEMVSPALISMSARVKELGIIAALMRPAQIHLGRFTATVPQVSQAME